MTTPAARLSLAACVSAALLSCATQAPLRPGAPPIELDRGSVGFFTLRMDATHNPDFEPRAVELRLTEVLDGVTKIRRFPIGDPYSSLNLSSDYLISFQLPAGDYVLEEILGRDPGLFGNSFTSIPLNLPIHLAQGQFVYFGYLEVDLGRWSARLQAREPFLSAVGSNMAGVHAEPIAFEVHDRFDEDVARAKASYGLPASADVLNAALPGTPAGP